MKHTRFSQTGLAFVFRSVAAFTEPIFRTDGPHGRAKNHVWWNISCFWVLFLILVTFGPFWWLLTKTGGPDRISVGKTWKGGKPFFSKKISKKNPMIFFGRSRKKFIAFFFGPKKKGYELFLEARCQSGGAHAHGRARTEVGPKRVKQPKKCQGCPTDTCVTLVPYKSYFFLRNPNLERVLQQSIISQNFAKAQKGRLIN